MKTRRWCRLKWLGLGGLIAASGALEAGRLIGDEARAAAPPAAARSVSAAPVAAGTRAAPAVGATPGSAVTGGALPPSAGMLAALAPVGPLGFEILDAATQQPMPARLTLVGVQGTADPQFTTRDIGRQEGDTVAAYNRLMSVTGRGAVHVPQGTYDIYVSRGPEWELYIARAVRITQAGAEVRATLRHAVDTTFWVSADFHVHSACSPDSRVPLRDRVYEFVSDGVDMIVATDHNVVCDYAPIIAELGVGRHLTSATGDELTTAEWGHFGAFPIPQSEVSSGHGALHLAGKNPAELFHSAHQISAATLVNVHHPRIDREIGYFNLTRFQPRLDRADSPRFSFDFDALEVLNGYQDAERKHIDQLIDDWMSLLNHGHLVTATGNSDTHHLNYNLGGYPRNYVRVPDDRIEAVTPTQVAMGVKGHHSFFTTAPFVRLTANGGDLGDLVRAPGGKVHVELSVEAAPWVTVSVVTLYLNGQDYKKWQVPRSTQVMRLRTKLELQLPRDAYLVARVDGDQPMAPVIGDRIRFDVRPLALTNPIFLDVDGDGAFKPLYPHAHR